MPVKFNKFKENEENEPVLSRVVLNGVALPWNKGVGVML